MKNTSLKSDPFCISYKSLAFILCSNIHGESIKGSIFINEKKTRFCYDKSHVHVHVFEFYWTCNDIYMCVWKQQVSQCV